MACVETVAGRATAVVAGNHEHGAVGLLDLAWFNPAARAAALWTRKRLSDDHQRYLTSLPLVSTVDDATLVHGSPRHPEEWDYLVSAEDGFRAFAGFETRLCFVGHSHRPGVWSVGGSGPHHEGRPAPLARVALENGRRYIVNVGSVGQPRDRDARASYAIWDQDGRIVAVRRVSYDHRLAAGKIIAARLPRVLADRLAHGV